MKSLGIDYGNVRKLNRRSCMSAARASVAEGNSATSRLWSHVVGSLRHAFHLGPARYPYRWAPFTIARSHGQQHAVLAALAALDYRRRPAKASTSIWPRPRCRQPHREHYLDYTYNHRVARRRVTGAPTRRLMAATPAKGPTNGVP